MSAIFKVCSCALSSGRTFLGVSFNFPLIALLLIHISMFLAELGFLQTLLQINFKKFTFNFSFRHPGGGLLEFSVDYVLLWSGFSNHVLKSYTHVFGRLKYTNTFKSILYHCFYPWLTDLSQSVKWGEFSMDGCSLKVSFVWLTRIFPK